MGYAAKLGSASSAELLFVNLGAETSINVKNNATLGPYYADLTTNNFFYRCASTGRSAWKYGAGSTSPDDRLGVCCYATFGTFSYNAATGVLTAANGSVTGIAGQPSAPAQVSQSIAITSTKYGYCIK